MRITLTALLSLAAQLHAVESFWRMICDSPIVTARIDPIVAPGAISAHTHAITGASGVSYTTTYEGLRASSCSTCQVTQDLSAYWVPQLYYTHQNGTYEAVKMVTGITVYYLPRGTPGPAGKILAIPNGLRMIAGDPFRRSYNSSDVAQRAIGFSCLGGMGYTKNLEDIDNCADGLRGEVFFPNCWDGVNLDSDDHQSHMAYSGDDGNGACPSSHPVKLVSIFFEAMFDVNSWANDWWNGTAPPFVFAQGDPTGYGMHGDFISGWDADFLQSAVDTCTASSGLIQDCPLFDIDQDRAYNCEWAGTLETTENVLGTYGGLATLPGCNPVTYGPAEASVHPAVCPDGSAAAAAVVSVPTSSSTSPTATSSSSSSSSSTSSAPSSTAAGIGAAIGNVVNAAKGVLLPSSSSSILQSTTLTTVQTPVAVQSTTSSPTSQHAGSATVQAAAHTVASSTQIVTSVVNGVTSVYTTTVYVTETIESTSIIQAQTSPNAVAAVGNVAQQGAQSTEIEETNGVTEIIEEIIEYYTVTRTLYENSTPYVQLYVIPASVSTLLATVTSTAMTAAASSTKSPITSTIYETITKTTIVPAPAVMASMQVLNAMGNMVVMSNETDSS